ncbi:hypothetical protein COO60DRAFT_756428 [Scenedesmus sp. NREL 46B-D3]|nr:hypothetical protein COO60DRAFT_756428 [Scenedesmus sp. NREL 46B-D3]
MSRAGADRQTPPHATKGQTCLWWMLLMLTIMCRCKLLMPRRRAIKHSHQALTRTPVAVAALLGSETAQACLEGAASEQAWHVHSNLHTTAG